MDKKILLYAVRHGTTELNLAGCFRGPIDVPLDSNGLLDAQRLKYYFAPIPVSHVFSSSKQRATQTADIISEQKPVRPIATDALHPWNVGDFAGKPKAIHAPELEYYINNPQQPVPGGESLNHFRARVQPLVRQAIDIAAREEHPVMIVAHSSVIHELGAMFRGDHEATLVKPGGVVAVYLSGGALTADPIFKPDRPYGKLRADTIS